MKPLYHPLPSVLSGSTWINDPNCYAFQPLVHLRDGILQGGNIRGRVFHLRQAALFVFHILQRWRGDSPFTTTRDGEKNIEKLVMFDENKRKGPRNS